MGATETIDFRKINTIEDHVAEAMETNIAMTGVKIAIMP